MDEKTKLLQLIKLMDVPLNDVEARKLADNLSSENISKLVSIYEDIKKFEDNIDFIAKNSDPQIYQKLKDEYFQKLLVLREDFVKNAESIQKIGDDKLDALESETEDKINNDYQILSENIDTIQKSRDSLNQYIEQKVSSS